MLALRQQLQILKMHVKKLNLAKKENTIMPTNQLTNQVINLATKTKQTAKQIINPVQINTKLSASIKLFTLISILSLSNYICAMVPSPGDASPETESRIAAAAKRAENFYQQQTAKANADAEAKTTIDTAGKAPSKEGWFSGWSKPRVAYGLESLADPRVSAACLDKSCVKELVRIDIPTLKATGLDDAAADCALKQIIYFKACELRGFHLAYTSKTPTAEIPDEIVAKFKKAEALMLDKQEYRTCTADLKRRLATAERSPFKFSSKGATSV